MELGISDAELIAGRRRGLAALWGTAIVAAAVGSLAGAPRLALFAWVGGLALVLFTAALGKLGRDERAPRAPAYRGVALALMIVALAGCALGLLPSASEWSQLFAPFFGGVAILAYRAVVARGPGRAVLTAAIGFVGCVPFLFITLIGCKCGRARFVVEPPWTERATQGVLWLTMLLLGLLVAVALVAFVPRTDAVPEARALR